jgi:DNA-binding NarL/FixJ family response regulator
MRVVIAEDLVLLRDGLARLLRDHDFDVVAQVEDAPGLLRVTNAHQPELAIVDVRLPPDFRDEGLRAALEARRRLPELKVLVLSQYVEPVYAAELLADGRGGVGYLLKERVSEVRTFLDAVRRVGAGGTALDPEVVASLVNPRRAGGGPLSELTPRELEVLGLVAEGHSNAGIAETLVVTSGAVEKHISRIFDKLGLPPSEGDHRRVLAVLAYLKER